MKSSIFKSIVVASMIVLATGCGKKGGGGGGSGYPGVYNNLYNTGISATGQQALTNLGNWFNGTVEGTAITGVVNITKTAYTQATNVSNCKQDTWHDIPYTYCTSSSSTSNTTTAIVGTQQGVNLMNNTVAINAKGNAELNSIFSGSIGTLIGASDSNNVAQLDFLRTDGTIVTYIINRNYHSLLNPIQKIERSQTQIVQTITTAQRIY